MHRERHFGLFNVLSSNMSRSLVPVTLHEHAARFALSQTSGASGGGGGSSDSIIKDTMADLLERLPDNFEMITMQLRAKPLLEGESGPFVVVALQVRFWDSRKRR